MVKKLLPGVCLVLALTACATTPPAKAPAVATATPPTGCVSQTASRIPRSPTECAGFGRTYTQEEIQHTGATDPARALRLLDPAITSHGP